MGDTWSLTLREVHRLRVFEKVALRRVFGLKREEVTGGWRKLHNEELHNLYSSPSIIRMIKSWRISWSGYAARLGKEECVKDISGKAKKKETTRNTKT
jgi:hypothetical protein